MRVQRQSEEVTGAADDALINDRARGSAAAEFPAGRARSDGRADVLINQLKVPATRLQAKSYGLTRPVETNDTDAGRAHNRRVEVSRRCQ